MKIHPIVSIAQLEPAEGIDPYNRRRPDHPGPVEMDQAAPDHLNSNQTPTSSYNDSYKVEQILSKQIRKYGKEKARIEYRVKWTG